MAEMEMVDFGVPHWVVSSIFIPFNGPLRNRGCQKPFPHPWEDGCMDGTTAEEKKAA
jgi:hypothetical protein